MKRQLTLNSLAMVCSVALILAFSDSALAQTYPARTVRMVHGFASGSAIDVMVRPLAAKLSESLSQQVVVDSRPGATGIIANELVAKSTPDGYTLLAGPGSSLVSTPHIQKVPFDPLRDFAPVAQTTTFSFVLIAHPAVPAKSAKDLVVLGKARPAILNFGSTGVGSAFHLAGELFAQMAGIKMLHVPYRGGGTGAITDLIGGRVDLMWESPAVVLPYVKSGRLIAVGVTGPTRNGLLPEVPTIGESGLPGYNLTGWHGVFAPAATPKEIVERLNSEIVRLLTAPDLKELWARMGMETPALRPEQFAAVLRADYDRYGKLIAALGINKGR